MTHIQFHRLYRIGGRLWKMDSRFHFYKRFNSIFGILSSDCERSLNSKKNSEKNLTGLIWIYLPFSKNRHFASKICWYRLKLKGMGTTNCTFDPSIAGDGVEFPCYVRSDLSTIFVVRHCWKSTCDHFFNVLKMYFNVTRRCQTSSTQAQVFNTTWKQQKIANHKWNVRRIS